MNAAELGITYTDTKKILLNEYKKETLLPHNISQNGPFTAVADVNGDDLEDVFIGGALGQEGVFISSN